MKKILLLGFMIIISSMFVLAGGSTFQENTQFSTINSTNFNFDGSNNWVNGVTTINGATTINGNFVASADLEVNGDTGLLVKAGTDDHADVIIQPTATDRDSRIYFRNNTGSDIWRVFYDSSSSNEPLRFFNDADGSDRFQIYKDGTIIMPETYGDTVGATNRDLYIDNTGKIGYLSSSERYKTNIQDLNNTNWIYDLRPVSFDYINPEQGLNKIGLIAEEVEEVNPNIVSYNILDNGSKQVETVIYSDLVIPLLKELQEANERITYLEEVLSDKYSEIVPQYQTSDNVEYVEQPDFTKPIECRADNIKYCFTEEACLFNNGYWDGSKCSELKDNKYC